MHKFAILKNEDPYDHLSWVKACEDYKDQIIFEVFDLTDYDWLQNITDYNPEYLLLKPSAKTTLFRTLYQERIEILCADLGYKTFPSLEEVRIYENKRYFSYWAKANNIPYPNTYIFYNEKNALNKIKQIDFPVVGKLNIGASGSGVQILKSKEEARNYIKTIFTKGISSSTGPKLKKGKILQRIIRKITHPAELFNRLKTYDAIASDRQKGFVILQEYIPHEFEWRVVRIGDSFFAHKKLKDGEKASGTLLKNYDNPPLELFNFVNDITNQLNFKSVAIDLFEKNTNEYLINEIQCIFGQSDPYQMLVNGNPGRYLLKNNSWVFEEGDFNQNKSFNLRLEYIISKL